MTFVVQISGVGGGGAGSASASPEVLICWKYGQNPWKSGQNLWKPSQMPWKSRQSPRKYKQKWRPTFFELKKMVPNLLLLKKNGAQPALIWLKKWRPKSHEDRHPKYGFYEKIFTQKSAKNFFGQVWENSGKNPSHLQTFACSYTCGTNNNLSRNVLF